MKKLLIAALAVCGLFASCSKDNGGVQKGATQQLSIKISGVIQPETRAIEAPGATAVGTIKLNDGHIFVLNPLGAVTHSEELDVTAATTGGGQVLGQKVAADSRVYIIGNMPTADAAAIKALDAWGAIVAKTSEMTTQGDYAKSALANSESQPVQIIPGANNTAAVNVSIKPLISRLELAQLEGDDDITDFTVTGVYVDDYYPSFTYVGGKSGTMFSQGTSTTFTGIGDAGTWAATGTPKIAVPEKDKVWAHNVASGGLPRFIIRLENIKYVDKDSKPVDLGSTPHYLTIKGYTGVTEFLRGKIYRIGGDDGITFGPDDLSLTPNPVDIDLTLSISIKEWELVTPDGELM